MHRALRGRRLDMVPLLVKHGFDPKVVDMNVVFETWDTSTMEYFIDRGADLKTGEPLAVALCQKIRSALGIFKKYREQIPEIHEQANTALRRHCWEGNMKWVSLMLWAGADPHRPGPTEPCEKRRYESEELSALGLAALGEHFEVFDLKPIRERRAGEGCSGILKFFTHGRALSVLMRWLDEGMNPNDLPNGGSSVIQGCLEHMSQYSSYSEPALDSIRCIHLMAKRGAKWVPEKRSDIIDARASLRKMSADFTLEFVWIMSLYGGCSRENIHALLESPTMKSHLSGHFSRLSEMLSTWDPV